MRRNQAVEALRILAAFWVVVFHSHALGITFGGMSAFIVVTMYFEARPDKSGSPDVATLATKLLIPWAFWYCFFWMLEARYGALYLPTNPVSAILEGPAPHLWYLPFVFMCVLLIRTARQRGIRIETILMISGIAAILIAATYPLFMLFAEEVGVAPIRRYTSALLPALVGVVIGAGVIDIKGRWLLAVLGSTLVAAVAVSPTIWSTVIAGLAVLICANIGRMVPGRVDLQWLSNKTFGVFLIHPLCLHALHKHLHASGLLYPITAFTASILAVWVYQWARARSVLRRLPTVL